VNEPFSFKPITDAVWVLPRNIPEGSVIRIEVLKSRNRPTEVFTVLQDFSNGTVKPLHLDGI
jgi:hypothetical protein